MFNETLVKTATTLCEYCESGQEAKGLETLYAPNATSAEAVDGPDSVMPRVVEGVDAIKAKHAWWYDNFEEHSSSVKGPFLHGDDSFSVIFEMDVTEKASGERTQMQEIGHYTVGPDGKIVAEAFYYPPMG